MTNLGYYNGKYGPLEEMTIPMNDRVSYFGDGVYDATYTANHVIFALDEHVDRLFRSMEMIRIQPDKTKEEVKELLKDMVRKVDSPDQFVYIQVTRGTAPRAHIFPENTKPNWWITLTLLSTFCPVLVRIMKLKKKAAKKPSFTVSAGLRNVHTVM